MPRGYDITFGDPDAIDFLGLMLYEDSKTPKSISSVFVPAANGGSPLEDAVISDWSNGLGYSRPGEIKNGYGYLEFGDSRTPGMILPSGAVTEIPLPVTITGDVQILGDFTLNGHWYLISTRYIFKLEDGTGTPGLDHDFGVETYDGSVVVTDYAGTRMAFIGRATGGFSRFDGVTFRDDAVFQRRAIAPVFWTTPDGVTVRRLVAADTDYSIRHCALTSDPMLSGSWSSSIVVGEGAYPIRSLTSAGRHVYINTTGGVYDLNEVEETLALTPYMQDGADTESGLACRFYDKYVMYNTPFGIDAIDVSQNGLRHPEPNFVTPGAGNESPIWGRPTAQTFDQGWFVASIFNNDHSYVIYGKPRAKLGVPGRSPWIWHGALAVFENQKISLMKARTVSENGVRTRYLYVATEPENGNGPPRLFKQSLPRSASAKQELDALVGGSQVVNHRFYSGFTAVNTPLDWSEPTREKTLIRVDVGTLGMTDGNSAAVSVSADGEAYATIGSVTVSPLQPLPSTEGSPQGLQLAIKVEASGTAANPPMLTSITARSAIDHEQIEMLQMDVAIVKNQMLTNEAAEEKSDVVRWRQLAELQNTVQTFVNPLDETLVVLVEPGITHEVRPVEPVPGTNRGWVRRARIRLRVLDLYSLYDTDALYDFVDNYS